MRVLIATFATLSVTTVAGQTPTSPPARFDVASVKRVASPQVGLMARMQGTTVVLDHITLRQLLFTAYTGRFMPTEIVGGPEWINRDQFQITATKADSRGDSYAMLRALLAERFGLRTHIENRDLPVYELVQTSSDGRLGPKLLKSTTDCTLKPCGSRGTASSFSGIGATIQDLIDQALFAASGRRILNKTGLTGTFDIEIEWNPEGLGRFPDGVAAPENRLDGPSMFTVIQDQLGLKLQSATKALPVLVIDSVSMPEPD